MRLSRKKVRWVIAVSAILTLWLMVNPSGRFGLCCYAYTTFSGLPRPVSDFQVRADGDTRTVEKTHQLTYEQIEWLLEPKPEVLIIAVGWDGVTEVDARIRDYKGCEIHLLKNAEAIKLHNTLKRSKKRIAIHYHSTC